MESSDVAIVQPLKTCKALDGCFIDNRYIAKYDALEESFFGHQYESKIMMIELKLACERCCFDLVQIQLWLSMIQLTGIPSLIQTKSPEDY